MTTLNQSSLLTKFGAELPYGDLARQHESGQKRARVKNQFHQRLIILSYQSTLNLFR